MRISFWNNGNAYMEDINQSDGPLQIVVVRRRDPAREELMSAEVMSE